MWIKYIAITSENRVGDIVFVGSEDGNMKIQTNKAIEVMGPDGQEAKSFTIDVPFVEKPKIKRGHKPK